LPAFVFVLAFLNTATAAKGTPLHVSNGPQKGVAATTLHLNEHVHMGAFSMQITALERSEGHAAKGMGSIFVPFLQRSVAVQFESISVDETGELMSGEIHAQTAELELPTYRSKEAEVMAYLQYANGSTTLPQLLNTNLQAMGMDLGGHDLVMTNLAFTTENASFDAAFLVQNTDGSVTTFTHQNIPLAEDGAQWCGMQFEIVGGNQPSTNDPAMPIIIKGYNVDTQKGTYVAFSCAGFEEFHLEGEYRFDTQHIRLLANQGTTRDTVIASFSLITEVWGQFMASITFNGPFEIKGVDDVIITLKNATIDYSDTANPTGDSLTAYVNKLPVLSANKNIWRGFFIETISVQMPSSLAVSNGNRIVIDASNLIYDRSRGLTTTFSVLGKPNIAKGSLEGWGIEVNKILLQVLYSSPKKFEIAGNVNIPLMTGQIGYKALFNFPGAAPAATTTSTTPAAGGVTPGITPTTKASLSFELTITNSVFTVPLLQGAELRMTNSVAGFEYVNSKFTPYANLNGVFKLSFTESGGSAAEFKFPELGFQNLALNYDFVLNKVLPEPPPAAGATATPSGGLRNMAIRAFTFAGQTFLASTPSGGAPSGAPAAAASTASTSTAPTAAGTPQTVKGFPISIKNIKFGSQGDFKKLDFTIALNFTNPSMGLAASADLAILGKLNVGKIMTSAPWEALAFESLLLNSITIGTKDQPCNIGGVSLYGGLIVIRKHPTYGDGFKGFLVMSVEPGITVDVVGQFGTIPQSGTAESYRYWFADAKMTIKAGIRLGPAPLGVFGFGGGAYYNMTQATLPASSSLSVSTNTPAQPVPTGTTFTMSNDLLVPGQGLSCTYTPKNNVFGVKATVILGTHPSPETANMDLTLSLEFNTSPFGLRTVSLEGAVFFMAPIASRKDAKVKGTMAIVYNHIQKTLSLNGGVVVAVKAGTMDILTGGGNFAMFFNLNPGQSSDWYMAIGSPPISKRMRLQFNFGTSQTVEGYFVAGNISRLPPDQRTLPRLREYDPLLQQFEGQSNLNFDQLMGGNGILMGMRYAYAVEKKVWIIFANLRFAVGFDAIMTQQLCAGYNPTGIDNWYIRGQLYGALEGSLKIRVNLLFRKGTFNIATLNAAALLTAELPNPTWAKAQLAGSYRILGGLVKGKFKIDVEFGTKCTPLANNLDAGDVVANIKVIGDIFPTTGTTEVPVFREKIVVASYLESVNKIMDFSEESDDGLMVKPVIYSAPITGGLESVKGYWRYLNANNIDVGANGNYDKMEYVSTKLLTERANYTFNLRISWKKRTRDNPNWTDVWLKNVQGQDSVQYFEAKSIVFTTGRRPTELPVEAVLASFPEIRAINYGILENPAGAGIALKQEGWGYLFNPKKRIKENATPCEPTIAEYNYFLRIMDVATNKEVFEGPLTAVPVPEWNRNVGDPIYVTQRPCITGNAFWDWLYRIFNIPCTTLTQGPCAVMQPTQQAAKSNVKNMANAWGFGGATKNYDLGVSQNANVNGKAIGFPDFSGSLEKGKIYRFELVGHPILEADTYTINASAGTSTTVTTASGNEYTVTESGTQSIQGQFSTGAPEKILYQSVFGTSQFNSFAEKLGNSRPTFAAANSMLLRVGQDTLFNNLVDFLQVPFHYQLLRFRPILPKEDVAAYDAFKLVSELLMWVYSRYPVMSVEHQDLYNAWAPTFFSNYAALQYRLEGITEGFDIYEMSRLAYFANYDFNTGYSKYMKDNMPVYHSYEKLATNPFENDIIPKGPYVFCSNGTSNTSILPIGSTAKQNAMGIELKFYPRTTGIYKIMQMFYTYTIIAPFGIYYYPFVQNAAVLPTYESIPAANGDLFKLRYTKGSTSANLAFNKEGVASGSFLDYSGDYWLQNVGSGRPLREGASNKVVSSTFWQGDGNYRKFRLTRNADGSYLIRNLGTNNLLSQTSTTNDITGNWTGLNITLVPAENGSFQFRAPDGSFLVENFTTKILQKSTATSHYDYDRFILSTSDIAPPTDLNQVYRLQNLASGRYVYDGNDSPGNVVTTKKENRAANAQFQLRRREGGYYDLIATNGRRILAKMVDNDWVYTTSNETGLDESHYQFWLENQSGANYRLKNKKSEEYLYENFDVTLGETHRQLLGSLSPTVDGYDVFVLSGATAYTTPTDLSGQYLIQTEGSGRYLHDDVAAVSTNIQENTASSRFVLKKVIDGASTFYEIWNKGTGRRMHWENSGTQYKTSNPILAKTEYRFTVETANNGATYAIKRGTQNLFELFDLNLGTTHRTLQSSATITDTDYARFKMLQEKDADGTDLGNKYVAPTDISGRYFIQTKGSERFLQYDANNPLFAEIQTNFRQFVLKRRNGTDYEIWCRNITIGGRMYPKTGGGFTFFGTTPDATNYLFTFTPDADGYRITHKNSAAVLYEHFELGTANDKKLLSGATSGGHYATFLLKDKDNAPTNYAGLYRIRSKTTNQYWRDLNWSDNAPSFVTSNVAQSTVFKLVASGSNYVLQSPEFRNVEYSYSSFWGFTIRSTTVGVVPNADGSVKLNFVALTSLREANSIINLTATGSTNTDFFLEPSAGFTTDNLSGEYRVQGYGSGQYLQTNATGTALAGNTDQLFVFQKQGTGIYEIKNKANNLRLHATQDAAGNWSFTTAVATDLTDQHYQFKLIPRENGLYAIQCMANGIYLYENFELNPTSPLHKLILGSFSEKGEYGLFYLRTTFTAPPANISGLYLLKGKGSGRYVHCAAAKDGGLLTTTRSQINDNNLWYILKRRATGDYEIWNKASGTRVHTVSNGSLSIEETPDLPDASYRFAFTAVAGGNYEIFNGNKVYEYFDLYRGPKHGQIWNTGVSRANYQLFALETAYLRPDDLSGEYLLRTFGSGRNLCITDAGLRTLTNISSDYVRFLFERQPDGSYKIKSKGDRQYLHLTTGGTYTTTVETGLAANTYLFNLSVSDNLFRLQCKANNEYLYEKFDLNMGTQHRQILSAAAPDADYNFFYMESEYNTPPEDISGDYLIQVPANGKHLMAAGTNRVMANWPATDNRTIHFVVKRRGSGFYEIWGKEGVRRIRSNIFTALFNTTTEFIPSNTPPTSSESEYLYTFERQADGTFRIKNNAVGYWRENSQSFLSHLGTLDHTFRLSSTFTPIIDVSGLYHLKVQGSNRHLFMDGITLTTTWERNDASVQFLIEKQANNAFRIKSLANNQYLHLNPGGGYSTDVVTNLAQHNYEFNFVEETAGVYKIQCRANGQYLYEFFDLQFGSKHRQILSSMDQNSDYNFFLLEKTHTTLPTEINGAYFVRTKGSELYWNETGMLTTATGQTRWIFKPRVGGTFEIWNSTTQKRLHSMPQGGFSSADMAGLAEESYRFVLIANGADYLIRCQGNGAALFEDFDPGRSVQPNPVLSANGPKGDDGLFTLSSTFTPPPTPLFNTPMTIRNVGSEGTFTSQIGGIFTNTYGLPNTDALRFTLRWRSGGFYELWSIATKQRLCLSPNGLATTGMTNDHYLFRLIADNGVYQIQCKANNQFLTESVSLYQSTVIIITGSPTIQGNDSRFTISQIYIPITNNISGKYFIKVSGANRWLFENGGAVSTSSSKSQYYLRRRAGGQYEIWSMSRNARLNNISGALSADPSTFNAPTFWFSINRTGNEYNIVHISGLLNELKTTTGATMFKPGTTTYSLRLGGNTAYNCITKFVLETVPPNISF